MDDINSQTWRDKTEIPLTVFAINRSCGEYPGPCCVSYPCEQQVGQGHDGSGYLLEPIYVWNNTGTGQVGCTSYSPDECGNSQACEDYIEEGRDYVTTARPGYAKFTYPHPSRAGGSAAGGSGGGAGSGGSGGGVGAGQGTGGGVAGSAPGAEGADDGCGCRVPAGESEMAWPWLLVALLGRRLRRRKRN